MRAARRKQSAGHGRIVERKGIADKREPNESTSGELNRENGKIFGRTRAVRSIIVPGTAKDVSRSLKRGLFKGVLYGTLACSLARGVTSGE